MYRQDVTRVIRWTVAVMAAVEVTLIAVGVLVFMAVQGCAAPTPEPEVVTAPPPVTIQEEKPKEPEVVPVVDAGNPEVDDGVFEITQTGYVGVVALFDYNRSTLTAQSRQHLNEIAGALTDSFTVIGHCDERGTEEYNLALGEARARAVVTYLGALGVRGMRVVSKGELEPLCRDGTEYCHSKNRRVELQGGE